MQAKQTWRAHTDAVTSLQLLTNDQLLSASSDRNVHVWNAKGERVGWLQQRPREPLWNLDLRIKDVEYYKDRRIAELLQELRDAPPPAHSGGAAAAGGTPKHSTAAAAAAAAPATAGTPKRTASFARDSKPSTSQSGNQKLAAIRNKYGKANEQARPPSPLLKSCFKGTAAAARDKKYDRSSPITTSPALAAVQAAAARR